MKWKFDYTVGIFAVCMVALLAVFFSTVSRREKTTAGQLTAQSTRRTCSPKPRRIDFKRQGCKNKTAKKVRFTCEDGGRGEFVLRSCASKDKIRKAVREACRNVTCIDIRRRPTKGPDEEPAPEETEEENDTEEDVTPTVTITPTPGEAAVCIPEPFSPGDASDVTVNVDPGAVEFTWNGCSDAAAFNIQVQGAGLDTWDTVDEIVLVRTFTSGDVFAKGTDYEWRVASCTDADCTTIGDFSDIFTFTTNQ